MRFPLWIRMGGFVLLASAFFVSAGCTDPYKARGVVKGQVTIGGKPLNAGTVSFVTKDNRSGSATIDAKGNYVMGDAPIGDVQATVTVPKMGGMAAMGHGAQPKQPAGMPEMKPPDGSGGPPAPAIDPTKMVQIPDKYGSVDSSGLTYKVGKGEQTINIELK